VPVGPSSVFLLALSFAGRVEKLRRGVKAQTRSGVRGPKEHRFRMSFLSRVGRSSYLAGRDRSGRTAPSATPKIRGGHDLERSGKRGVPDSLPESSAQHRLLPVIPVAGDLRRKLDNLELGLNPLHESLPTQAWNIQVANSTIDECLPDVKNYTKYLEFRGYGRLVRG
jgi:hypothetical protein